MAIVAFGDHLLLDHRLERNHRHVAAALEGAVLIEHVGDTARHPRREVAAGLAEHRYDATGHVFAAMVARALDHRDGARVADGKAFASDTAEVALAFGRAIEGGVADNDRVFG